MRRSILVLMVLMLLVGGCARPGEYWTGGAQFQEEWEAFYRPAFPHEPDLDDPLIAAGSHMVPAICEAVVHRNMRYRRYAIGALGYIGDAEALPTLQTMLRDESEEFYFRYDALISIYRIDEDVAIELAPEFVDSQELGGTARAILAKEPWLKEPSEE